MKRIQLAAVAIIVFVGLAPTTQAATVRFAAASGPSIRLVGSSGEASRVGCEDTYAFTHRASQNTKPPSA